jgi:hypothetical protein
MVVQCDNETYLAQLMISGAERGGDKGKGVVAFTTSSADIESGYPKRTSNEGGRDGCKD